MNRLLAAWLSALVALSMGCDTEMVVPDGGMDAGVDSGMPDDDGGPPDTGIADAGGSDAGGGCPSGEHMCSTGCERDRSNEPSEGCRNGCGLECPGVDPICNSDGQCSIGCDPPAVLMGAVCCGGTLICSAMVAARCPSPTEEPNEDFDGATDLGNFIDNDSMASIGNLTLLDSDEDWFTFTASDSPSVGRTEFLIDVTVRSSTPDVMEVAMWFECEDTDTTSTAHEIVSGTANAEFGDGASTPVGASGGTVIMDMDCVGSLLSPVTDESGTVHIRVRRTAATTTCENYELSWRVHEEF